MKKNIYIHALEIGVNHMSVGISYNELLMELEKIGIKPEGAFRFYFQHWYFTHFYIRDLFPLYYKNGTLHPSDLTSYESYPAVLMENGYTEYLDFLKLEQARIDTQKAHDLSLEAIKWSRVAVYVSIGMAAIQILLQFFQGSNSCH